MSYGQIVAFATKKTSPTQSIFGRTDMVKNHAGGFVFEVSDKERLTRFLILGSLGGTYYVGETKLTDEITQFLTSIARDVEAVDYIIDVATAQPVRAPTPDHAIYALAVMVARGTPEVRARALGALGRVCRIPTHLFSFLSAYKALDGGMGRSVQRALQKWYQDKGVSQLSYHALKYQSRDGWSNRDVLRLARPTPKTPAQESVFKWIVTGETPDATNEYLLDGHRLLRDSSVTEAEAIALIHKHGFTHEMVPTQFQASKEVMNALFQAMPIGASLRKLGQLTALGLLDVKSDNEKILLERLAQENLIRGRIHPLNMYVAQRTYASGQGNRGDKIWTPNHKIVSALEEAFYDCFGTVEPTGKRFLIGVDCSASMTWGNPGKMPMNYMEAAALMAMLPVRTEESAEVMAFSTEMRKVNFTKNTTLSNAAQNLLEFGGRGTNCALPMIYALKNKIPVDVFAVYTDNETWAGSMHPVQALKEYRQKMGIPAKLMVHAFAPTKFTIADPTDPGMMDLVGIDSATPQIVAEFCKGF